GQFQTRWDVEFQLARRGGAEAEAKRRHEPGLGLSDLPQMNCLNGTTRRWCRAGRAPAKVDHACPADIGFDARAGGADLLLHAAGGVEVNLGRPGREVDGTVALRQFGHGEARLAVALAVYWRGEAEG